MIYAGMLKIVNRFSIGLLASIISLLMFVNTSFFFPNSTSSTNWLIMSYLVMLGFAYGFSDTKSKLFNTSILVGMKRLLLFGIITYFFFGGIGIAINQASVLSFFSISFSMVLLQSFVIATAEESFFRGFLGGKLQSGIVTSLIFSLFHFVAYEGNLVRLLVAFILGYGLYVINKKYGLEASIGAHAGFNMFIEMNKIILGV